MFTKTVKKILRLGLAIATISASPTLAAPISPQEIVTLTSDTSHVSVNGENLVYFAPDGSLKITNIETEEVIIGKWHITTTSKVCVVIKKESCYKATQTKAALCFSSKGKKFCRSKEAYMRGDQTSVYLKK